jgi:hypothetical protein
VTQANDAPPALKKPVQKQFAEAPHVQDGTAADGIEVIEDTPASKPKSLNAEVLGTESGTMEVAPAQVPFKKAGAEDGTFEGQVLVPDAGETQTQATHCPGRTACHDRWRAAAGWHRAGVAAAGRNAG